MSFFDLGGFHLADEEMPDKADLPEVLRVLDVVLRRLSDGERLPLALVKFKRQCVAGQGDAVSSPRCDQFACPGALLRLSGQCRLLHRCEPRVLSSRRLVGGSAST